MPQVHDGFGDWLRDHRLRAKLGLRELARLTNSSASYLSRLEHGQETSAPSEEWIEKWAERIGMQLLFTDPGPGMHHRNCMLATWTMWRARRIPQSILDFLTRKPEPDLLVLECENLRKQLTALYRLHCPDNARDKIRHDEDPQGWNLILFGTLKDTAKLLCIDRDAEWKRINAEMDELQEDPC